MSELNEFRKTILPKVGEDSCSKIKEILLANNFTSRLSLKLLTPANLDVLFTDVNLPLGSRKVLEYQLNLLNDESPLNTKAGHKRSSYSEQEEVRFTVSYGIYLLYLVHIAVNISSHMSGNILHDRLYQKNLSLYNFSPKPW